MLFVDLIPNKPTKSTLKKMTSGFDVSRFKDLQVYKPTKIQLNKCYVCGCECWSYYSHMTFFKYKEHDLVCDGCIVFGTFPATMDGKWIIFRQNTQTKRNTFHDCNFEDLWFANEEDLYNESMFTSLYVFYVERSSTREINYVNFIKSFCGELDSSFFTNSDQNITGISFAQVIQDKKYFVKRPIRDTCRKIANQYHPHAFSEVFFPDNSHSQILPSILTEETVITRKKELLKLIPLIPDLSALVCRYENKYCDDISKYDDIIKETNQQIVTLRKKCSILELEIKTIKEKCVSIFDTTYLNENYQGVQKMRELQAVYFKIERENNNARSNFRREFNSIKLYEHNFRKQTIKCKWILENNKIKINDARNEC